MCCQRAVSEDRARAAERNKERDIVRENAGSVLGLSGPKGKGAQTTTDKTQSTFLSSLGVSKASVLWGDQSPEQGWSFGKVHGGKLLHSHKPVYTSLISLKKPKWAVKEQHKSWEEPHVPQGRDLTNQHPAIQPEWREQDEPRDNSHIKPTVKSTRQVCEG